MPVLYILSVINALAKLALPNVGESRLSLQKLVLLNEVSRRQFFLHVTWPHGLMFLFWQIKRSSAFCVFICVRINCVVWIYAGLHSGNTNMLAGSGDPALV